MECLIDHVIKLFTRDPALSKHVLSSLLKKFDNLNNEDNILAYPIQLLSKDEISQNDWETFVLAFKCPKSISDEIIRNGEIFIDKANQKGGSDGDKTTSIEDEIMKNKGQRRISFDLKKSSKKATDGSEKDSLSEVDRGTNQTEDEIDGTENRKRNKTLEDDKTEANEGPSAEPRGSKDNEIDPNAAASFLEGTTKSSDDRKNSSANGAQLDDSPTEQKLPEDTNETKNDKSNGSLNDKTKKSGDDSKKSPSDGSAADSDATIDEKDANVQIEAALPDDTGPRESISKGEHGKEKRLSGDFDADVQVDENEMDASAEESMSDTSNEKLSKKSRRKSLSKGKSIEDRRKSLPAKLPDNTNPQDGTSDETNGTSSNTKNRRKSLPSGKDKKGKKPEEDTKKKAGNEQWWMKNKKNRRKSSDENGKKASMNSKEAEKGEMDRGLTNEKGGSTKKVDSDGGSVAENHEGVSKDSADGLLADSNVDKFEKTNTQPSVGDTDLQGSTQSQTNTLENGDKEQESSNQIDGKNEGSKTRERRMSLRRLSRNAVCLETIDELDSTLAKPALATAAQDGIGSGAENVNDVLAKSEGNPKAINFVEDTNSATPDGDLTESNTSIISSSIANDSANVFTASTTDGTAIKVSTGASNAVADSFPVDASAVSGESDSTGVDLEMSGSTKTTDSGISSRRASHESESWSHRHSDFYHFEERDVDFYEEKYSKLPPSQILHSAEEYELNAGKNYEIDYNTNMDIFDIIKKMRQKTSRVITKQQQINMKMRVLNTNLDYMP